MGLGSLCRSLGLGAIAKTVEGDAQDVLDLTRIAGRDLGDPHDHLHHLGEPDVLADGAGFLGALQQRFAGLVERRPAKLEQGGVAVEVVEQLLGERLLGREIGQQALEPRS